MVIFNECKADIINNKLIIDVSIDDTIYSKDVGIGAIHVVKSKDFVSESTLPENKVTVWEYTDTPDIEVSEDVVVDEQQEIVYKKRVRINFSKKELDIMNISLNDILFIYVETIGVPSENTPCGCDNKYSMCVTFNLKGIYNKAMSYLRELDNTCDIPKNFINLFLKLKAFELSLQTGNYNKAISLWNTLGNKTLTVPNNKCGCN